MSNSVLIDLVNEPQVDGQTSQSKRCCGREDIGDIICGWLLCIFVFALASFLFVTTGYSIFALNDEKENLFANNTGNNQSCSTLWNLLVYYTVTVFAWGLIAIAVLFQSYTHFHRTLPARLPPDDRYGNPTYTTEQYFEYRAKVDKYYWYKDLSHIILITMFIITTLLNITGGILSLMYSDYTYTCYKLFDPNNLYVSVTLVGAFLNTYILMFIMLFYPYVVSIIVILWVILCCPQRMYCRI